MGPIHKSNSPWASAVVLVRKKDGCLRFCIDLRKLNAQTIVMTDNISCLTHFPKDKTEHKVDSLNIYCETLCHNKVYMKNCSLSPTYSIPQNQVICTT